MRRVFVVVALSLELLTGVAAAQDLSGYTYGNAVVQTLNRYATPQGAFLGGPGTNPPPTGPGNAVLPTSAFDNASGTAVASFGSPTAGPAVSAMASLSFDQLFSGVTATAQVNYAFEVVGDSSLTGVTTFIDLTAFGALMTSSPPSAASGMANSTLVFDDLTTPARLLIVDNTFGCGSGSCTGPTGFAFNSSQILIPINHVINVFLSVTANQSQVAGSFQAVIDPVITLDPAALTGLVLVFDPSIQQPVPEASTHALMLIGLGLLVLLSRRHQR